MRPVRAAVAKNIKNAAAGSIHDNKINSMPFTSKDLDDYSKSINATDLISCGTTESHSLSVGFKIFGRR
jgi:hypothetical protein